MTLHDKKGRPIAARDFLIEVGHEQRWEVEKTGRKYVTVRMVRPDGSVAPTTLQFECDKVLIVKQVDGEWVTDWDKPRPAPGRRIAWGDTPRGTHEGFVGDVRFFTISWSTDRSEGNVLRTSLPGLDTKRWPGEISTLKLKAEQLWEGWLNRRGAFFHDPEAQAARDRVRAFLAARREVTKAPRGGLTKDIIYSVGTMDGTVDLLLADLEALVKENG